MTGECDNCRKQNVELHFCRQSKCMLCDECMDEAINQREDKL
jgi:hypothetical protein